MHLPEYMKIFLDTADTDIIRKYYGTGLIDGITTNPTLIRKSGRDPDGLLACAELSCKNLIRVNVTLIFDVAQAILAAKAGAAYVSPFVGRLDDNSIAGLNLIKDIDEVFRVQCVHRTKILSASIRYVKSLMLIIKQRRI